MLLIDIVLSITPLLLYYTILWYAVLCFDMLYYTVICYTILHHLMQVLSLCLTLSIHTLNSKTSKLLGTCKNQSAASMVAWDWSSPIINPQLPLVWLMKTHPIAWLNQGRIILVVLSADWFIEIHCYYVFIVIMHVHRVEIIIVVIIIVYIAIIIIIIPIIIMSLHQPSFGGASEYHHHQQHHLIITIILSSLSSYHHYHHHHSHHYQHVYTSPSAGGVSVVEAFEGYAFEASLRPGR